MERQRLISSDRARRALSLLLIPAKDGGKRGTPVAAEEFFNQMEIYPGMSFVGGFPTETTT